MEKKCYTVAIIGCGGRGGTYGGLIKDYLNDRFRVVALCDINPVLLELRKGEYGVAEDRCFEDENKFFEKKRADIIIIGTQDKDHARMTLKGLELGYHVLEEKPICSTKEECVKLLETQKKCGGQVFVCHVLRYAQTYKKVEELMQNGCIGKLVSLSDNEQIWYGHFAHSYVRGNWRNTNETAPVIIAKSCHDLDMLQHLAGAKCDTISSVGDISWFKRENAPEGSADRCVDCKYMETCPYSAKRLYIDRLRRKPGYTFARIITRPKPLTEENVWEAIKTTGYGKCVYKCDNNVCDNQMCLMTFENGVKAVLITSAFTGNGGRVLHVNGTLGEIILDEENGTLTLKTYGKEEHDVWKNEDLIASSADKNHDGGDLGLLKAFYESLEGNHLSGTTLEDSIESHFMGFAAEESRKAGGICVKVHSEIH